MYWGKDPSLFDAKEKNGHGSDAEISWRNNNIYIYDMIDWKCGIAFAKALDECRCYNLKIQADLGISNIPINVYINSVGGYVCVGVSILENIRKCIAQGTPIHTHVTGEAASAATFISVVGSKRTIGKHSTMMIHQLSTWFNGKHSEFVDKSINLETMMKTIKDIYLTYTKIDKKTLDKLLVRDIDLTAKECLKYGFVDEIL
jgi:ATP-dependent protease ClpP protease subunit